MFGCRLLLNLGWIVGVGSELELGLRLGLRLGLGSRSLVFVFLVFTTDLVKTGASPSQRLVVAGLYSS